MRPNKIKRSTTSETDLVKEILDFLSNQKNCFVWRNTNGTRYNNRSAHYIAGVPDILGVWCGRPLAVEVKTKTGKVSKEQIEFIEKFEQHGGIGFVARSLEDVVKKLLREPVQAPPQTEASQS